MWFGSIFAASRLSTAFDMDAAIEKFERYSRAFGPWIVAICTCIVAYLISQLDERYVNETDIPPDHAIAHKEYAHLAAKLATHKTGHITAAEAVHPVEFSRVIANVEKRVSALEIAAKYTAEDIRDIKEFQKELLAEIRNRLPLTSLDQDRPSGG